LSAGAATDLLNLPIQPGDHHLAGVPSARVIAKNCDLFD
jgi:hypothetical protein